MYLIKTNTLIITRFLISIQLLLLYAVDALDTNNNNNNNNRFLLPRIIEQPKSQIAISGSKVQLKCDYEIIDTITLRSTLSLSSHIQIKWLFNLMPIDVVFNQNLDYMQDNNKLTLLSFDETKQSGEYRCLINNTYQGWSVLSEPANLSLAYIDNEQFDKSNKENIVYLNISEGNVAIIQCKLPASNPPAIPIFVFNNTILIDNEIPRYKIFSSGNLQISNVKHTDSGIYTCSARNPITNEIRNNTKQTILRVFEPVGTQTPEIIYAPNDANRVQIGSNLTLECVSNGAPVPLVTWEKFGGTLPDKRSTQIFGNLIITNIQPEDKGTYVCRADNGPGQATFKTAMLDVFEAPTLLVLNDAASSSSNSQIVKYYANKNDNIELKCPIRSRPKSDVVWFFNGRLLNTNQRVSTTYLITDRSLLIKNVNQQLIGPYQCYAKNDYGYKQAQIILYLKDDMQQQQNSVDNTNVAVESSGGGSGSSSEALPYSSTYNQRPVILIGPQNVTIYEGQTAVLLCVTDSNSQINWLKNDIIIEPSLMRRFEINPVGNLRIVSAQKSDTGVYKCIASNEYGMSSAEGYVFVKDDELSQQQQQQPQQRKPQLQPQPKSNDNQFDDAKYSKQQLVTPVRPQIEQIDVDKILLKWSLNTNNIDNSDTEALTRLNEDIDYFKIEYKTYPIANNNNNNNKKQFSNNWITIDEKIDSSKREYILTDLSPNEQYRFRISCFSKTGQQTHSQQSLKFKLEVKQNSQQSQSSTIQTPPSGSGSGSLPSASSNDNTIEIQIQQVWAISDSSLAIKWQLFDNNEANTTGNGRQMIDGFYIYYRKLVNIPPVVSSQQTTTPSLSAYQTITLPNSPLHLVDTYVITNLDASSTYEIKLTCFSSTQKVTCDISNTIYGLTLNKDFINTNSLKPHILNKLNEQQFINNDLANTQQSSKQNEIIFMVVGIALGVLSLLLIMFMVMCIIRHRERRRLLKKLNASQKLNGGSSCPTLIYDDCIRNQHQQNGKPLFDKTSTLNNMLLINNLQQPVTTDPNHTQPPPLPIVPPPSMNTMGRNNQPNMNININPLGSYLDASNIATFAFLNNKEQQQQENFYHTLNTTICNQFANGTLNPHAYDYNNATLNLRAQLILKQQQLQALQMSEQHQLQQQQQQQQQQQKQRNTLQRASFSSSSTSDRTSLERNNESKTSSLTPKKRARRNGSNRKMKKVDKVYQQVLHPNEQQTLLFANQQQQQNVDLINMETPYQTNNRLFANQNFLLLAQKYQNPIESHHLNPHHHHHQNDLLIATTNSNSSSGIGSSSTDCGNEELVPFIFSNNAALNSNINATANTTTTTTANNNNNTNSNLDNEQETAYANSK